MVQVMLATTALLAAPAVSLETVEGSHHAGILRKLDRDQLVIGTGSDSLALPIDQLLRVSFDDTHATNDNAKQRVLLSDGSLFPVHRFKTSAGQATVDLPGNVSASMDTRVVHAVRFFPPSPKLDPQWQEIVNSEREGDVVVIRKSALLLDYLEGAIGKVTDDSVDFLFEDEHIDVSLSKLEGVVYLVRRPDPNPVAPRIVRTVGNGIWHVRDIVLEGNNLRVTTSAGANVQLPAEQIESIDFSAGKIVYLSELDPLSVDIAPKFPSAALADLTTQLLYAPGRNKSLAGDRLQLRSIDDHRVVEEYDRGLALHSRTTLVYRLPGEFGHLRAIAGLDPRMKDQGHVRLEIAADNNVLLDISITGHQPPVPIELDIAGARRLKILVDYGDDVDVADHLNLCNLRVTP